MSTKPLSDLSSDMAALRKVLVANQLLENDDAHIEVEQFTNGFSNLTYLIKTENQECVLRRPPIGAIKRGHDMGREYKVLSALSKSFSKIPTPIYFEADTTLIGAPFYLMEKIDGVVINYKEALARKLSSDDLSVIADSWLSTFVELHELDYKSIGLAELGRPEGYVERQITNWSKQYLKAATDDIPVAETVMSWLHNNQPRQYDHCLIHNDFKYDNIIFEENNWANIKAVLDWEMCTLGDPLMDLGTSLGYWTMKDDGPAFLQTIPSPTILDGNPNRSDVVEMYASKSGRSIDNLIFYYSYGLFKIAVIVQQIYYRYHKGLTQNKKFENLNKVCAFLFQTAQQAIDKSRIENLY